MNYDERLFGWDEWKAPKAIERVVGKDFLYGVTQVSVDQRQRFRDSDFSGEVFSDEDMSCVAQLSGIRKLFIAGTDVGDKGLQRIRHVSSLDELTLIGGYLSDRGLENLPQSLGSPESISLHDVEVSFEGISKLIEERNWSDSAVVVSGVLDLEVASWLGAKEFTVFTASDIDRLPQLTTEPETNSVKELLSSGAYVIVTESDRVSMVMLASKVTVHCPVQLPTRLRRRRLGLAAAGREPGDRRI